MGTTSDKLAYLNTTKQKLKDSINALGGDITSETTFRNYVTELDNIYSNLPKTTGEGSNLSLTTLKGRINVDDILGDTEQDTTNGYQLIDLTLAKLKTYNTSGTWNNNVYTISGVTITINDDMSIKVNGTTTAQVGLLLAGGTIPYPTGTYYLSGAINGSNDTYDVRIFNYDGKSIVAQCFTGTKQVAIVNNSQSYNMALIVRNGVTCNNTMFYPMLSTTNTSDYEPYTNGASPNPSYPQDIEVVTGTIEVVERGINLLDKTQVVGNNTTTIVTQINTGFRVSAEALGYAGVTTIDVKANTNYFLKFNTNVIVDSGSQKYVRIFAGTTQTTTIATYTFTEGGGTFNTGNNTKINIWFYCSLGGSGTVDYTNVQLQEGSTATTYEPYQTPQTYQLSLGEYELAKIGTYQDRIFETSGKNKLPNYRPSTQTTTGITLTNKGNGLMVLNGTASAYTQFVDSNSFELEAGTYTLWNISSFTAIAGLKGQLRSPDGLTTLVDTNTRTTFTLTETTQLRFREVVTSGTTLSNVLITPMILKGDQTSTIPNYEPYGSDKWYLEKNIGKKDDIKATDFSLYNQSAANNIYQFRTANQYLPSVQLTPDPFNIEDIAYSNYFLKKAGINNLDNYYFTITGNGALAINVPYANATRLAEWMNGKTIEVYYQMATPTYTEITNETLLEELNELEKMMSYNGQTNISVSGNLPMIINVTALKGESE